MENIIEIFYPNGNIKIREVQKNNIKKTFLFHENGVLFVETRHFDKCIIQVGLKEDGKITRISKWDKKKQLHGTKINFNYKKE